MTALNNACVPPHNGKVAARSGPIDVYCPRVPNLVDPFREMLEGSPTTAALLALLVQFFFDLLDRVLIPKGLRL